MGEMACDLGQVAAGPRVVVALQRSPVWYPRRVVPSNPAMTAVSRAAVRPRRSGCEAAACRA